MIEAASPLLSDPVRAIRVEAARVIAEIDPQTMTPEQRGAFAIAYQELINAEMINSDRPKFASQPRASSRRGASSSIYRTALRLDPKLVPARVNLTGRAAGRGQDKEGAALLRAAIAIEPNNAAIRHSRAAT